MRRTAQAAEQGADVRLLVSGNGWPDAEPAPGVTLRRLPGDNPRAVA